MDTALAMVKDGKSGQEIKDFLEETGKNSSIYITVATLKYLKKGGRLTPAVAAIGTMLRLKPVLRSWTAVPRPAPCTRPSS